MPLLIPPLLRRMAERANPHVCDLIEVAQPDAQTILRRYNDQFSLVPPLVSVTPASSTQASPGGGMMLAATLAPLVSFYAAAGIRIPMSVPDPSRIIRGVGWQLDPNLKPIRIRQVTAKISTSFSARTHLELQIYRMRGVPGRTVQDKTGKILSAQPQLTPTPLLSPPCRIDPYAFLSGGGIGTWDMVFNLIPYQLDVEHRNVPSPSVTQAGEIPEWIFEIYNTDNEANGNYRWEEDNTTNRVVAGLGTFSDVTWDKRLPNGTVAMDPANPQAFWGSTVGIGVPARQAQVPCIKIDVDTYPATSQAIYQINLPKVPDPRATGRVSFKREVPLGTQATLELSTAGSSGPWTPVTDGALVPVAQAQYHLRTTLTSSSDQHRSPVIDAIGIDYRIPVDVSAEGSLEPLNQDVNTPFLDAAVGEGRCPVVRTGRRDYRDPASDVLATTAATQLELDHWIGSRHPLVTRDSWLHTNRAIVTSSEAAPTTETLSLISYLKRTKRKIPQRVEEINQVLTVNTGSTATNVRVTTTLPGASSALGGEYAAKNYYIRIRSTTASGLQAGMMFAVANNADTQTLVLLSPGTPVVLALNDTIELHSASFAQPKLAWSNADPADVWLEILTVWLGIPLERIGLPAVGRAGRAGFPPKVTDRAPGDAATQALLRVSNQITDQAEGKTLIDALSFLMQGATVEINGQIVFVQIYDLLDPNGVPVNPAPEVAATFDPRDYYNLATPRGLENRVTTIACDYGVDVSLGSDAPSPSTVVFSDGDAVSWFTQQDLEEIGNSSVPDDIAKWCFNSADGGFYLAALVARQVVRACSTGMRVWSWRAVDIHPELLVGDRVVLITDQYTDYDPSTQVSIRGMWAFPLVLVHVADRGRDLRGFMLGLSSAVPVLGGGGTPSVGLIGQPSIGAVTFTSAGDLLVTMNQGNPNGAGFRIAASSTGVPSDADVDAASWRAGNSAIANLGSGWATGVTVYVKVIAYASDSLVGARSFPSVGHAVNSGGGTQTITGLTQTPNYAANTVSLDWASSGGALSSFDVYVYESAVDGPAGMPSFKGNVAGPPFVFSLSVDIQDPALGAQPNSDLVHFYVVGKDGSGNVLVTSDSDAGGTYGYGPPPPVPSVDTPVITPDVGAQTFTISWTPHNAPASPAYTLYYRAHPTDAWSSTYAGGGLTATITQVGDAFTPGHHRILKSFPPTLAQFQAYVEMWDPGTKVATSPVGQQGYYDGGPA